jgi:hypothetical protein
MDQDQAAGWQRKLIAGDENISFSLSRNGPNSLGSPEETCHLSNVAEMGHG